MPGSGCGGDGGGLDIALPEQQQQQYSGMGTLQGKLSVVLSLISPPPSAGSIQGGCQALSSVPTPHPLLLPLSVSGELEPSLQP